VRWFNTEKGFGFIARDSGDKDVFVHISAVERSGLISLSEGDRVIIDVVEGRKALEAREFAWSKSGQLPHKTEAEGRIPHLWRHPEPRSRSCR